MARTERGAKIEIEANDSGAETQKEKALKMLRQLEDPEGRYDSFETDVFDHKTRNAALQNGEFSPPSGTIFEAIFQELKRKKQREKVRRSFSNRIPRLHACGPRTRSIKRFTGSMKGRFQSEKVEEHSYEFGWPPVINAKSDIVAYLDWSLRPLFMHRAIP